MRSPPIPEEEAARLQDLYAYEILDTASERIFEEIAELAAVICGTRFAAVSLIDRERQWFKASHGVELRESSRDQSICGHAILEADVFEVPNVSADERFVGNPLLTGHPRYRFYAGSQLRSGGGHAIGTLCVLDSEPGQLSENQRQSLRQLSSLVMAILEARRKSPGTPDWLGSWLANVSEEVYVRDPNSDEYVYANEPALRRAGCTLAQLRAGASIHKPEGDGRLFPTYVQRLRGGEPSLSFESTRVTPGSAPERVNVSWNWLSTPDSAAILSIVRGSSKVDRVPQADLNTKS